MDLNSILKKTKETSDRVKRTREPVYIATEERPYEEFLPNFIQNNQLETVNKVETNNKQSTNKPTTNHKQTNNHQEENWQQTVNKVVTQPITQLETKRKQTINKPSTICPFSSLVGLQRSILILIYQECKKSLSKITEALTLEYIANLVNSNKTTVKTTIYRLDTKGCLVRSEFKNGRGGWTRYELPEEIFRELLQNETVNKLITNGQQTVNKVVTQPITQPITSPSSSSSSNNIKITTTTDLPSEWKNINFSELEQIGFNQGHLLQLYRAENLNPAIIQESINYFAYDLVSNNKAKEIKTNPLGYFMGILKRTGIYTAPDNYESPQDKAMRVYLNTQKALKEKRASLENDLMQTSYEEWLNELSEDEKNKLLPESIKNHQFQAPKTAALKGYYEKNIWHIKKDKIVKNIMNK